MSRNSKIVILVFVLIGVLFLISKFFHISPYATEVCPPDKCKIYETGKAGQPIGTTIKPEPGRTHTDSTTAPIGLPKDIPVDPKPSKVVTSYVETLAPDKESGEPGHTQITYAYITKQSLKNISDTFQSYLKKNNYDVQVSKQNTDQLVAFYGHRVSGPTDQSIIVNIVTQNQFEQLVTISLVISGINPAH